jgi:fructose-specific phosphotransferase system IIC component
MCDAEAASNARFSHHPHVGDAAVSDVAEMEIVVLEREEVRGVYLALILGACPVCVVGGGVNSAAMFLVSLPGAQSQGPKGRSSDA